MRTIGIDPGTARLGYGVIDEATNGDPIAVAYGVITTEAGGEMPKRLVTLFDTLSGLLVEYRPDVLAVEQLFFARNVTTAITVGQARGIILLAAAKANISVVEYSPSEIKHAVAGYGKAGKAQMQEMVKIVLGLATVPQPDDAADALAIALCHAQTAPFLLRTGML